MPKRGENIYKRKDGRWEGRYIKSRNAENKAKYGYIYGKSYTEVKGKLRNLSLTAQDKITERADFEHIAERWYETKRLSVKSSTLARYRSALDNHVLSLARKGLSSDNVREYLNDLLSRGYSAKTVNDILTIIKNILAYAETVSGTGGKMIDFTIKTPKKPMNVLTESEEQRLCGYLRGNLNQRNLGILICMCTGLRIGEICALRWSDVNLDSHIISINHTLIRIQNDLPDSKDKTKVIVTAPKSDDSHRQIPISLELFGLLFPLRQNGEKYVLTGRKDKFAEPRNMQYYFKNVLKACGIKDYPFHALRHTFATRCVEQGVEIKSLSEILGHSSIKITLDRYVHSSLKLKRRELEKIHFLSA